MITKKQLKELGYNRSLRGWGGERERRYRFLHYGQNKLHVMRPGTSALVPFSGKLTELKIILAEFKADYPLDLTPASQEQEFLEGPDRRWFG